MKNKVLYILLSVVVACGLWLYVITVVSPESRETFRDIPVVLQNEKALHSKGMMVTSAEIPTVTLALVGNRSDLRKLNASNITLVADLSKIYRTGEQYLYYDVIFPVDIPVSIEQQDPAGIRVIVSERATKEVPVVVEYSGKVPEGFLVDKENQTLDYETVSITGQASVVEKIHQAKIQVNLEGQRDTISQSYAYTLCDEQGNPVDAERVVTDVTEVKLTLEIQYVKQILLELNVIPGGGATEATTKITLSHTSIQVAGAEQVIRELPDIIVIGELRLADLPVGFSRPFPFKLPEGVENLSMEKNEVAVSVEFPNLKTKTIRVTNIQASNVPAGMEAEFLSTELTVNIRGPEAQIMKLTEANVTIVVDLSNAEVGTTASYPAQILVDMDDCGAVGSYPIYAKVVEAAEVLNPQALLP